MDKKFFEICDYVCIFISQPDNSITHVCVALFCSIGHLTDYIWTGIFSLIFQKIIIAIQDGNYHGQYSSSK